MRHVAVVGSISLRMKTDMVVFHYTHVQVSGVSTSSDMAVGGVGIQFVLPQALLFYDVRQGTFILA